MSPSIRILVIDDHPTLRRIITNLLDLEADMRVVGQASNAVEALKMVQTLNPDVVVMDFEIPGKPGASTIKEILLENPQVAVIGFSAHDNGHVERLMLEAGAAAYVSKSQGADELLSAIREHMGTHA